MTATQFLATMTADQASAVRKAAAIVTAKADRAHELARMATRWPKLATATALYLGLAA